MNLKSIAINSLLIGLVIISLIYFNVYLGNENNVQDTLTKNPAISRMVGNITQQLNESTDQAYAEKQALAQESSNPVITTIGFFFRSILNAGNTLIQVGVNMFSSIFTLGQETLHIPPLVTGVLMSVLVTVLVLAAWRVYRAGE